MNMRLKMTIKSTLCALLMISFSGLAVAHDVKATSDSNLKYFVIQGVAQPEMIKKLVENPADPWVNAEEAKSIFNIDMIVSLEPGRYDAVIICVGHNEFREIGIQKLRSICKGNSVIFDVKSVFKKADVDGRL